MLPKDCKVTHCVSLDSYEMAMFHYNNDNNGVVLLLDKVPPDINGKYS